MVAIPDSHISLFERPIVAALATIQPDGGAQVTPVWVGLRNGKVLVNTAAGRRKYKNLVENGHATVLLIDPDNGYNWMEVRGKVAETIHDAPDDINELSHKYNGADYPFVDGEVRVTFLIEPDRVLTS